MDEDVKTKSLGRKKVRTIAIWSVVGVIVIGLLIIFGLFRIQEVEVVGNEYYTADEIKSMVMSGSLAKNSIYLTWQYNHKEMGEEIPFLSAVEVEMNSPYKVTIRVFEKTIVGYMQSGGNNIFFDKDGSIMESSLEVREGVPLFTGISLENPEVLKKLPIKDAVLFKSVVTLAQLLNKSEIVPDKIYFDESQNISLYFPKNTVLFGEGNYLEEKVSNLKSIYPKMESMEGILHMENFGEDTNTVTFKKGTSDPEKEGEEPSTEKGSESETTKSITYEEKASRITKDADGNEIYTDDAGNTTSDLTKKYANTDGSIVSDGYGYIDPYTGAYIN